jgi:hypothetical protein
LGQNGGNCSKGFASNCWFSAANPRGIHASRRLFKRPVWQVAKERISAAATVDRRVEKGLRLGRWGENPIKGQDSEQSHLGYFAVPAAIWAFAGDFLVAEHFHRLVFRKRRLGALALQVDIMTALWACEDYTVGFVHDS